MTSAPQARKFLSEPPWRRSKLSLSAHALSLRESALEVVLIRALLVTKYESPGHARDLILFRGAGRAREGDFAKG